MHDVIAVADSVRDSCIEAAIRVYEDAGISGLCAEGRWELAIQAMQQAVRNPFAIYRELDLGEGGYAIEPARHAKSAIKEAIRRKHKR